MTPPITELEWVRPPLQARSAQTLERLLDAAEGIVSERGVEAVTVAEVVKRAESSVGAFYARFGDKEKLLRCVIERFHQQAIDTATAVFDPTRWDGVSVRDILASAVSFLIRIYREKRQLVRAAGVRADATAAADASLLGVQLGDIVTERVDAMLQHRGIRVAHPDPRRAVRVAVWMTLSAFHSQCFTPAQVETAPLPDHELASEITQMLLAYLGLDNEGDES